MDRDNENLFDYTFATTVSTEHRLFQKVKQDETSCRNFFRDLEQYVTGTQHSGDLFVLLTDTDPNYYLRRKDKLQSLLFLLDFGATLQNSDFYNSIQSSRWMLPTLYPTIAGDKFEEFGFDINTSNLRKRILDAVPAATLDKFRQKSLEFFHAFYPTTTTQSNATWQPQEDTVMTTATENATNKVQVILAGEAKSHSKAAIAGVKLELGRAAIQLIKAQLKPRMPAMLQVVMDTPVADLAIATSCSIIATVVTVDPRAKILSEAMLTVAYGELLQKLQLPEMINGVLNTIPAQMFAVLATEQQAE
jgi:hypothetical protein